ncbi:MAG: hypothetical protein IPK08_19760 [Bacteroidetes bacterium]|nr:hypothetical protein [Bacteroidota bacterium]
MVKNLNIVFTKAEDAPENVSAFLNNGHNLADKNIIAITFENVQVGSSNINNSPDLLIINDIFI